jgi:ribonuclease G
VSGASSYEKLLNGESDEEHREHAEKDRPLPPINKVLKKGDEVVAQVVKEPIRTKGARLTTHVSIPGRFLVLMPFDATIGISRRIEDRAERDRIRRILADLKLPKEIGFIVRTAARNSDEKDFAREVRYLMRLWEGIKNKAKKAKPGQLIHQEYDLVLRTARDIFTSDFQRLEVDSKADFKRIHQFLRIVAPHLLGRLKLYRERTPIFDKFGIEQQVEKIYGRQVHLKSGGYLVFDETESLVAIDVNSGKSVREKSLEETAFKTNLEAAREIPRQLKLRDIGGIIIIDFIDMEMHGHRKTVFRTLEKELEDDKAKTKILNISSIGLVEMTRQRVRRSIEGKTYRRCPYCSGRGIVKSPSTVSLELARRLEHMLLEPSRSREIFVRLHPDVAAFLYTSKTNIIKPLEKQFRKTIRIIEDPKLHIEEMRFEHKN